MAKKTLALSLIVLAIAAGIFWAFHRKPPASAPPQAPPAATVKAPSPPPAAPVAAAPAPKAPAAVVAPAPPPPVEIAAKPSNSPAEAKIAEAARTGTHIERLTPMAAPPPFDPQQYAKDPVAYCQEVVPGRIYQTAKPGPDAVPLTSLTKLQPEIKQGDSVELAVKAIAGAPVTFSAKDGGFFGENHLNSITVQANSDGKASVHFMADQGVIAVAEVMAGCPMTVGNTLFSIYVHYPGEPMPGGMPSAAVAKPRAATQPAPAAH